MAEANVSEVYDAQAEEMHSLMDRYGIDRAARGAHAAVKAWADLCGAERWFPQLLPGTDGVQGSPRYNAYGIHTGEHSEV